jgi:bleomycin hydrolase
MSSQIERKLREYGMKLRQMNEEGAAVRDLREAKERMLMEVYQMLAISLGEPPQKFQWRYKDKDGNLTPLKTYTPKEFYKEFVGVNLRDYVMFMNDPSRPYGKLYEIEYDRHSWDGDNWKYINLQNDKIKEYAKKSIMGNDAMYFSCDVGKQLNKDVGVLEMNNFDYAPVFGVDFGMNKTQRVLTSQSGSSHGMTLIAVDVAEDGNVKKWLLENSWGPKSGYKGNLIMTDNWFDQYMFRVVIHKKYVDEETLKILEQEPEMLPPWDPMY